MTNTALASQFFTKDFDTYLALEESSTVKHEFYRGLIFAMAGGTDDHSGVVVAAISTLIRKLRAKSCFVRQSDLKIVTPNSKAAFYPDASVFCNQKLGGKAILATTPTLVLEVLSPSTRNFDLNAKRKEYFRIPSLRHYLVIDSESIAAKLYTRNANQLWPKDPLEYTSLNDQIPLTALKITLKLRDLYRQTSLL